MMRLTVNNIKKVTMIVYKDKITFKEFYKIIVLMKSDYIREYYNECSATVRKFMETKKCECKETTEVLDYFVHRYVYR